MKGITKRCQYIIYMHSALSHTNTVCGNFLALDRQCRFASCLTKASGLQWLFTLRRKTPLAILCRCLAINVVAITSIGISLAIASTRDKAGYAFVTSPMIIASFSWRSELNQPLICPPKRYKVIQTDSSRETSLAQPLKLIDTV